MSASRLAEPLLAETVQPLLGTAWVGRAWRHLPSCASTNDEAARWARGLDGARAPDGAVVVAEEQTRGRGRLGRTWHAAPGDSLILSVVLRPPLPPPRLPPLTLVAGVALAEAVARLDVAGELKWPNDLLVRDPDGVARKAAGILTEVSAARPDVAEHVVVGIGVNVNTAIFPDEIAARATSLRRARGGAAVDRVILVATLLERLETWVERFIAEGPAPVVEAWTGFARFLGTRVEVTLGDGKTAGIAEALDPDGALRLRTDTNRTIRIIAGEVLPT